MWNGPAGYFENPNFSKGSEEIAKKIIDLKNKSIYSVAGGGDTIAVLNKLMKRLKNLILFQLLVVLF